MRAQKQKQARWITFLFWKPVWISLKRCSCICFDLSLQLLSFWNGVNDDFQKQRAKLIFKNCKFSNWHKNLSSPKIQTCLLNSWFDASNDHMSKLKSSEKDFSRQKESIIGVQWRQENPNPRVHRSSRKRGLASFPLERWTRGLGFSCRHWTSMIDSFSHMLWICLRLAFLWFELGVSESNERNGKN